MSSYKFIFAILLSKGKSVPQKTDVCKDYNFMPLGGSKIYTIDADAWKSFNKDSFVIHYPNRQEFNCVIEKNKNANILIALADTSTLLVPGRGEVVLAEYLCDSQKTV